MLEENNGILRTAVTVLGTAAVTAFLVNRMNKGRGSSSFSTASPPPQEPSSGLEQRGAGSEEEGKKRPWAKVNGPSELGTVDPMKR
jgi:hypothetical protein